MKSFLRQKHLLKTYVDFIKHEMVSLHARAKIHVYGCGLKAFPPSIQCMTNLKILYLGKNALGDLPSSFTSLQKLEVLDVSETNLSKFTPIEYLTNLRELNAGANKLTYLPYEIGQLTQLKALRVDSNRIIRLPREFKGLTTLTSLSISNNRVADLEPLLSLVKLTDLDVSQNNLGNLPGGLSRLTCLKELNACINRLTTFPEEIAMIPSLRHVSLIQNKLTNSQKAHLRGGTARRRELGLTGISFTIDPDMQQRMQLPLY